MSIFVLLWCYLFIPSTIYPEKSPEQPKHERGAEWARRKSDENLAMTAGILKSRNSSTLVIVSSQTPPNSDFRLHVEVPRGGQLLKTRAPEPPAGRFPKFLLPRAAGRPQKLKCTKSLQSPMLVRVVGREWNSGVPGGTKIFRRPHIGFAGPLVKYWRQGRRNKMAIKLSFATNSLSRETFQSHRVLSSVERKHDTMKPGTQFTQGRN